VPIRVVERRQFDPAPTGSTVLAGVAQSTGAVLQAAVGSLGREALVYGAYKPVLGTHAGLIPGIGQTDRATAAALVATDGSTGLQPGKVYVNQRLRFECVSPAIPAGWTREEARIRFLNCSNTGPPAGSAPIGGWSLFKLFNAGRCPITFTDGKCRPEVPNPNVEAFKGWDFEVYRTEVVGCIDSFQVWRNRDDAGATNVNLPVNVKLMGNISGDHLWFSQAESAGTYGQSVTADGPHADDVQVEQCNGGLEIRGNLFRGNLDPAWGPNTYYSGTDFFANGCLMIAPDVGPISDMIIEQNWLYGGGVQVNYSHKPNKGYYLNDVGSCKDNVFGRDTSRTSLEILRPTSIPIVCDYGTGSTANTFEDNGATVPLSNGG